jgi:integrase
MVLTFRDSPRRGSGTFHKTNCTESQRHRARLRTLAPGYCNGLRFGEAAALRMCDIDIENRGYGLSGCSSATLHNSVADDRD